MRKIKIGKFRLHLHTPALVYMKFSVNKLSPGGGEAIIPPRQFQFDSRRIYVRPRTGLQTAHLWWPAVAKLQAASVPIANGSCASRVAARSERQTDGSRYP